ncbi:MMPL family transporter [Streptomyces sp. NPDC093109]|uniref:MMPL family transporter n=1 Tax=Streptomyces sp. NPDC093109 TaxID=3154977 RepID=UPI00344FEFA7
MATFLYKLGRFAFRRRNYVALVWVALLALAGVGAVSASTPAASSFSIPGTEAQKAFDLLEQRFPGATADGATARVVFKAPNGEKMTDAAHKAEVDKIIGELKSGSDQVASVADPYTANAVSQDGSTAYISVSYKVDQATVTDASRDALTEAAEGARADGLTVEIGGTALQAEPEAGGSSEAVGVALAAVVLVITFGSMIAAGLPLLTAIIGVGISFAGITALAGPLDLGTSSGSLATMIGLAVGIDYALFIVSRYRSELAEGREREEAAGRAVGTAGSAVVFAGLTVVIALAGLVVVDIPVLTKMGFAAAGAVVVAVLVALTLVPAALGFAGKKVFGRKERNAMEAKAAEAAAGTRPEGKPNMGTRWARFVLRRPVAVMLTAVVGLGVIAIPATSLELGLPDEGSQSTDTTQRRAYDLLSDGFGPGFNGPLMVVVDGKARNNTQEAADKVVESVGKLDHVAVVAPPTLNKAGDTAIITVIPKDRPSSTSTEELVHSIRDTGATVKSDDGAEVLVTGNTAMNIDFAQRMNDALIPYLGLVVGLAFLLLMLVFRSILVPLKAALGFLLSVVATLGAVVAVFQWGWLASLIGVEQTGPVMAMMPVFLVGIVFGLAMDYEVFLVTRMREAFAHGEEPREAIVTGFRHSARVVVAAAAIMIAVFAGFIGAGESMIKMIGFGLAVAVLFDAFVVRMTIVPAVLALLGKRAWWLPRWLDRVLPNVDVEGEALSKYDKAPAQGSDGGSDGGPDADRQLVRV